MSSERACTFFQKGLCRNGEHCPFVHVLSSDAQKVPIFCRFGLSCMRSDCYFVHPDHEGMWQIAIPCRDGANCSRTDCIFAHPEGTRNHEIGKVPEKRICVWFQKGKCRNGIDCEFQHVQEERDGNIIVVRNLGKAKGPAILEIELLEHFRLFGYVTRVLVKTDLNSRCRGFAFIIFADTSSASEAMKCPHPVWDIKLKSDLPMYIEGEKRPSRKTHPDRVNAPCRLPFTRNQKVLLLGEGDFSFTAAAIAMGCLDASRALSTSIEPPRCQKHLEILRIKGVQCRTDVDARSLSFEDFEERFDVVFNFPHTGEPSIEANISLLKMFFESAMAILCPGGIVAALKQTWPYSGTSKAVKRQVSECCLSLSGQGTSSQGLHNNRPHTTQRGASPICKDSGVCKACRADYSFLITCDVSMSQLSVIDAQKKSCRCLHTA